MRRDLALIGVLGGVYGGGRAEAEPVPADVVAAIDDAYASDSAALTFVETVGSYTRWGSVRAVGPGQLRWEFFQTDPKHERSTTTTYILDGERLTSVDLRRRKVVQSPACKVGAPLAALSFLTGDGSLSSRFTPAIGSVTSSSIELELTPKTPNSQYTKVLLTVDASTYRVERVIVTDAAGDTSEIAFKQIASDATTEADTFDVDPIALRKAGFRVKRVRTCSH